MTTWAMPPTSIKAVVEHGKGTSTGAARVVTDVGYAWVKAMGNPQGPHALACDLVGTRLAEWLGLKTFDIALVEMDDAIAIKYPNGTFSQPGPAFVAREVEGRAWSGESDDIKHNVVNVDDVAGIVVFDSWTRNVDRRCLRTNRRNLENVFLSGEGAPTGKRFLYAMDHTECFRTEGEVKRNINHIDRVQDVEIYGLFEGFRPFITRQNAQKFINRLRAMTPTVASALVAEIPPEWDVSREARESLVDFIVRRAEFVCTNIWRRLEWVITGRPTIPGLEV